MTSNSIVEFFGTPEARFLGIPFITLVVSICLKLCSKPQIGWADRNLFYLGNNISTTAILILFVEFCNVAREKNIDQMITIFLMFVVVLVVAFGMTQYIRTKGWENNVINGVQLKMWSGIIFPDLVGFVLLLVSLFILY